MVGGSAGTASIKGEPKGGSLRALRWFFMPFVLAATIAVPANAATPQGAVISNGTVQLGVNAQGDLNYDCTGNGDPVCPATTPGGTDIVGLRYVPLNLESTAPGCLCEGWGVADAGSGLAGFANQDSGDGNITIDSFSAPSADHAVSTVTISDPSISGYEMHVVQDYHPSPLSASLYVDTVTVTNTGSNALTDLRYRRGMDWDVEPTAFSEWVTIHGTSPQLLFDSDDGFATTNPLAGPTYVDSESVCGSSYTGTCEFTDLGSGGTYPTATSPSDHGGLFDFGFGSLAVGASKSFNVYYGAADSETAAVAALTAGGAQVYSLGESNCGGDTIDTCGDVGTSGVLQGKPATFMFGFVTTTGDLSITKTDSPDPVQAGSNLTYSITVNNNGPEAATGVEVSDPLPAGVDFVSATPDQGSCSGTSTVSCNLGTIANSGSAQVSIVVKPISAGPLSNTASVSSASSDANQANNSSTATTTVNPSGAAVSIDDVSVTEGNSGTTTAAFTVSLSTASGRSVTVNYATADGTATQPSDYQSTSGALTFAPGQTSKTIGVAVVGETVVEPDETYNVNLSGPSNASLADGAGVGTIVNDDAPLIVPPSVDLSGLFCGARHRGRCTGLKVKGILPRPGNASWEFGAYNPNPGKKGARSTAAKVLKLGAIRKKITRPGSVTVVFKLKKSVRSKRLLKQVRRRKLSAIRIVLTFTDQTGKHTVGIKSVALKLNR
jgi:uncharacterized repeat protein (TIGR01451 family)